MILNFSNFFSKKIFISTILIIVFSALIIFILFNLSLDKELGTSKTASLILNIGGNKREFQGQIISGMTILDALLVSTQAGEINLKYSLNNDNQTTIFELNNHKIYFQDQINFYLNSKKIKTEDINKVKLDNSDIVEIKL